MIAEVRGKEVPAPEDGGGDAPAADRVVVRGVTNGGIVILGEAGQGVVAAAGAGIVGEIVTGGIDIIVVAAENVAFAEMDMVLLVMEALLLISEDDSIMAPRPLASFLPPAVAATTSTTSPHSPIVVPEAVPRGGTTVHPASPYWYEMSLPT